MNDTCATHRSRVPRRSFGRNKRRSDDIGRRERTRPGFYFMFCVWQSSVRGCRFSFEFVYFIIKVVECSPVPASFFPYIRTASLPSHLFFFCSSTTASGSHWRSPPLPAARSSQHRDPTQQRGLSDSVSLLPPGLRHQCNAVDIYTGRRRREPANIQQL